MASKYDMTEGEKMVWAAAYAQGAWVYGKADEAIRFADTAVKELRHSSYGGIGFVDQMTDSVRIP